MKVSREPHILVVDDEENNLKLLKALLAPIPCRVREAHDGSEALAQIGENPPDLILLDVMLPKINGFEVCRVVKSNPATSTIPVVMITALSDFTDCMRGLEAGADDFLSRPVNHLELLTRVKSLLKLKELQESLKRQERLQFLGEMAAMAAHEIRNPLTAIRGFAQILRARTATETRAYADIMISELDRINGIVEKMLMLRPKKRNLQPGDVLSVLKQALELARQGRNDQVRFLTRFPSAIPLVRMDQYQIK